MTMAFTVRAVLDWDEDTAVLSVESMAKDLQHKSHSERWRFRISVAYIVKDIVCVFFWGANISYVREQR